MKDRCRTEVVELHQFFQQWLSGSLTRTDATFGRVAQALGSGFTLITPDGVLVEREALLHSLREAHGTRPDLQIGIKEFRVHHREGKILVATYLEWQQSAGSLTVRLSTAIFRETDDRPNNLQWLHVHDTWVSKELAGG